MPAAAEAALLRLVQSRRVLHVVDHLPPVHDLHRPLHGVPVPAALRPRRQPAHDRRQDLNRLGRVVLRRRSALRPLHARQSTVAAPLQRYW